MKTASVNYEYLKIQVDQIADARGIIFTEKLKFVEKALNCIKVGQVLSIYCSDIHHIDEIPNWVRHTGHVFLAIIKEENYFKILIKKSY